jgi:hypothetical protein
VIQEILIHHSLRAFDTSMIWMEMLYGHAIMIDSTLMTRVIHDDWVDLSIEPFDMSHTPTRTTRDTDDTPLTSIGPELTEMIRMSIAPLDKSLYDTLDRHDTSSC